MLSRTLLLRVTITPPNNVLESEPGLAFQTLDVEWHASVAGCDIHPQALREQARELSSYRNLSGTTLCLSEQESRLQFLEFRAYRATRRLGSNRATGTNIIRNHRQLYMPTH